MWCSGIKFRLDVFLRAIAETYFRDERFVFTCSIRLAVFSFEKKRIAFLQTKDQSLMRRFIRRAIGTVGDRISIREVETVLRLVI